MPCQNSPVFIWKVIYWDMNNVTSPQRECRAVLSRTQQHHARCLSHMERKAQGTRFHLAENKEATSRSLWVWQHWIQPKILHLVESSCWMEVVHSKSLHISKPVENCNLKKLKGYSGYVVLKEGTVGCTRILSAHFRLFHSNNNTILYSVHMWSAYVYNKSSARHQTEAELFQSHCNVHYPDTLQLDRLMKVRGIGKCWLQFL